MKYRLVTPGSVAPLAILFTMVSMAFTVAYLKNTFSQAAMEKYRYSEWKALYAAEAGLNDVGIIVLPKISGDTLLLTDGFDFGKDENDEPIGSYKDIACSTRLLPNSTRNEYIAYSTGVANYVSPSGTDVEIERRVFTTMVPTGFEEFMYFTDEEEPTGPGNTGVVNFGANDQLEGKIHTNGQMTMSSFGCPDFSGEVAITHDAIEEYGTGVVGYNNCSDSFEDDDGNMILDTVSTIEYPPSNSAETARRHATRVFEADDKLFRSGKKDTLIMTEINFVPGGYWAAQWWYNIPPVGSPAAEYDFFYDSTVTDLTCFTGTLHLFPNNFDNITNTYNGNFLVMSSTDASGNNVMDEIIDLIENGDLIQIKNNSSTKILSFTATAAASLGTDRIRVSYLTTTLNYFGPTGEGFNHGEPITFVNTSASTGLNSDVEWNSFHYYHDHLDIVGAYCEAGRIQHFDFEYWNFGGISGNNCDIFSCPDIIYNSEYVHMNRTFFAGGSSPTVIYVKGGQVLVRGTIDGQYSIVTDDYTEYRRHDDLTKIDRGWGNIWLINDIVYENSWASGSVMTPANGGSNGVLGLIAGGNVIIANTRPNGAQNRQFGQDIIINASILAMNGGFISHYWQNSLTNFHDAVPITWNGITSVIADGRGGHRNYYIEQTGIAPNYNGSYTGTQDYRGDVNLWGSIVQLRRGYMLRNASGPYNVNAPGVGYDKNYHYDYNLRLTPPPWFPNLESESGEVILKMASYGEAK